jgi:Fe-S-cluster containining protein
MNLCDKCFDPGHCCREFWLNVNFWDDESVTNEKLRQYSSERSPGNRHAPFEPVRKVDKYSGTKHEETGRTYSQWYWRCPALTSTGKCGIYADRPELCRSYEPASSELCVHYRGAEGVDLVEGL